MISLIASVAATAAAMMLASSGLSHVRHPRVLRESLLAQAVLPSKLTRLTAVVVTTCEVVLGVGTLTLLFLRHSPSIITVLTYALLISGVLYLVFAAYAAYLAMYRPGTMCGCSAVRDEIADWWTVVRASLFMLGSFFASAVAAQLLPLNRVDSHVAVVLVASSSLAIVIANLPGALRHDMTSTKRPFGLQSR
jgi:hypothetical protein